MKRLGALTLAGALVFLAFALPAAAVAKKDTETFLLSMLATNTGIAPNGDTVEFTCDGRGGDCGTFSVHPKGLPDAPSGEFVHKDSDGNVLGGGDWTATKLLSYQSYGCRFIPAIGVDLGDDDLCGGKLKLRVLLDTAAGQFKGILTVFCIVGPKAPKSHNEPPEEGVTLNIPGVINFNHVAGGANIYVRQ